MLQTGLKPRRLGAGRLVGLLTVGLLLAAGFGAWAVFGQQRRAPDEPLVVDLTGDKPVAMLIYGNELTEWRENNERVVLMRGKVIIQQNLVGLCLSEGIAWISTENRNGSTLYHVDIYGETVDLEDGTDQPRRKAARAHVKMTTVGLSLKIFTGNEIRHASASGDPLFARAVSARGPGWAQAAAPQTVAAAAQSPVPTSTQASPIPTTLPSELLRTGAFSETTLGIPQPATIQADFQQPLPGPTSPAAPPRPLGSQLQPLPPPPGVPGTPPAAVPPAGPPLLLGPGVPIALPPGAESLGASPVQTPVVPVPAQAGAPRPDNRPKLSGPARAVQIRSRDDRPWSAEKKLLGGEWVYIIPTGINIVVRDVATNKVVIDLEADRLVYWSKDKDSVAADAVEQQMRGPNGAATTTMEFYLSGHVQIRNQNGPADAQLRTPIPGKPAVQETQILTCDECYYDVSRNVAVALNATVLMTAKTTPYPIIFKAPEIEQVGPNVFKARKAIVAATQYVSDPGIYVSLENAKMEQLTTPKQNLFGLNFYKLKDGSQDMTPQKIITGDNVITYLEGIPIWYMPWIRTDPDKPLGPLAGIGANYSTIFGMQIQTTWDLFELAGLIPNPNQKWQLYADYSSLRGPDAGTIYHDDGKDLFSNLGLTNRYDINLKLIGMSDTGLDQIGGTRGTSQPANPWTGTDFVNINHPEFRYWTYASMNVLDLPNYFNFMGRVSRYSDQNYLDQYFNSDWINGPNQDTFAYLKQEHDFWYWSILAQDRTNPWLTQTNWLPKLDGYVAGVDVFDFLTWHSKVSAGYAQLQITDAPPGPFEPTDVATNTARVDWWQEWSAPFAAGDAKLVPYAVTDLTYYSSDLNGQETARVYGGAGLRGSMPFNRLYADVHSDLFNLDGLYHKITLNGNYYLAYTNVHYDQLPQLDRLNDDESNQTLMNIHPQQQFLNPQNSAFLLTSKLFDPQFYALQRLLMTQVDTLDSINELQLSLNQRWQTKRGIAGDEHVVDWMTLDLGMTIFPQSGRDNFDQPVGFLSYDWLWNIGDRTSVFSDGWMDPIYGGPRFFTIGAAYNRPDKSTFTISYRQIDPLDSKAVIASVTYPLSAKYAITGSTMYDFGVNTQVNTIMLTRIGTDLRVSFGISYNSIINNFSVVAEVVPNLIPGAGKSGGMGAGGGGVGNTGR